MDCKLCQETLPLALDGSLSAARQAEFESHLKGCTACAHSYQNARTLRSALRNPALRYAAPDALKERIKAQMNTNARPAPNLPATRTNRRSNFWKLSAGLAAAIMLGMAVWGYTHFSSEAARAELTARSRELVAAHVRSLMAAHLADVISTDMHTVKPWFAGKLDFSPLVLDFADKDFKLEGGRLDYLNGRAVAALIYKRRQHVINVFTWPSSAQESDDPSGPTALNGYNLLSWQQNGMEFRAVSDMNAAELGELKGLIEQLAAH